MTPISLCALVLNANGSICNVVYDAAVKNFTSTHVVVKHLLGFLFDLVAHCTARMAQAGAPSTECLRLMSSFVDFAEHTKLIRESPLHYRNMQFCAAENKYAAAFSKRLAAVLTDLTVCQSPSLSLDVLAEMLLFVNVRL